MHPKCEEKVKAVQILEKFEMAPSRLMTLLQRPSSSCSSTMPGIIVGVLVRIFVAYNGRRLGTTATGVRAISIQQSVILALGHPDRTIAVALGIITAR